MNPTLGLVRLAILLLPIGEQRRFLLEWSGEFAIVREEHGLVAAIRFVLGLFPAAARMTMAIRADSESGYAELSFGIIFSVFPVAVLFVLALQAGVWIMVFGELALGAGILLMASGFWSFEGRLFDSRRSRVGAVLVVVGSLIEVVVRRSTGFGPPIDAEVSATIPHTLVFVGLALWMASSYAGQFRFRMLWFAVAVLALGSALNLVVVVINARVLTGFDRFGVLMYLVPSASLAWACYLILGRRQVFESPAVLDY